MKSIILSSVVTALLVLSGCSTKSPETDDKNRQEQESNTKAAQKVEAVETETVASEDSIVDSNSNASSNSQESVTMSMSDVEEKLPVIYFEFDKFDIKADMQDKITTAAELGKNEASSYKVKLEGNCDEWGSDEYNFALGLKRSSAVKKAFIAEGIDGSRISMVSYGESNPVCTDKTKECWSKNRRVDFKLLP